MYIGYNEVENFYRFLYEKPNLITFESDHIISRNQGEYANDGVIYYTENIARLMRTQAFRRMSKIFQLGTKFLGDNNLKHSRAEHSKGTYARTLELCMHLLENKNIAGMVKKYHYEKYIVAELIRGLTHDIGHGPFSHTMETICNLPKGFHEDIGKRIIKEDEEINETLNGIWQDLPQLLDEVEERDFLGLNILFEGQIDVDRGDFLARDSWAYGIKDDNSEEITDLLQKVSIKKVVINGKGKLVPVFSSECLPEIEKFLDARFNNYQKYYFASTGKLFEHIYKEFSEELLESDEEYSLKTFLEHNYNKRPEEVDLDEYIKYNDIEFLKGILEVYDNTKDEKLRSLARICIPDADSLYPLYYGLMVTKEDMNEDGNIRLSREDARFFDRISEFTAGSTIDLISKRYINQKCNNEKDLKYKLKEIKKIINPDEDIDMKDYGITFDVSKNSLYKSDAGEDIYVEDEKGRVYTYDKHPKRTMPLKKFTNVILIIDREKLKDKLKDSEKLAEIEDIARNRRKEAR